MDPQRREVVKAANDQSSRPVEVIALNQACPVDPPAEMWLLSLERWTTHFRVHWFFGTSTPSDDVDLKLQAGLGWVATDDRGNRYVGDN